MRVEVRCRRLSWMILPLYLAVEQPLSLPVRLARSEWNYRRIRERQERTQEQMLMRLFL